MWSSTSTINSSCNWCIKKEKCQIFDISCFSFFWFMSLIKYFISPFFYCKEHFFMAFVLWRKYNEKVTVLSFFPIFSFEELLICSEIFDCMWCFCDYIMWSCAALSLSVLICCLLISSICLPLSPGPSPHLLVSTSPLGLVPAPLVFALNMDSR